MVAQTHKVRWFQLLNWSFLHFISWKSSVKIGKNPIDSIERAELWEKPLIKCLNPIQLPSSLDFFRDFFSYFMNAWFTVYAYTLTTNNIMTGSYGVSVRKHNTTNHVVTTLSLVSNPLDIFFLDGPVAHFKKKIFIRLSHRRFITSLKLLGIVETACKLILFLLRAP